MARNSELSDGVMQPFSVHKNPAVTCSQKSFSTYAGSVENEEDDLMVMDVGTENQDTPVSAASRGNIWVFQSKEETLAAACEGPVRKKCVDHITVIRHKITPPKLSLSAANRIKHDVRKWCRKRYRTKCAESSECSLTQIKDDNSPTRLSSLSSSKSITTKADGVLPVQNEGQYTPNGAGVSSNIYQNAVLSSNTTVLSSKDAKVSIRSEVPKARSKPGVIMNRVRASASRKTVVANSGIVLKNTAEDILPISEKKNTASSSTVCGSDMLLAASLYRKIKSTLPSEGRKISEGKIKSTKTKKRGTSLTYKNVIPVNTLSDQLAVLPSDVRVPVDRDPCKNVTFSETSLYASGQHAFSSGHKTSLSRPMPSQKKNLNKNIIPAPADSDMKRQSALSSKHFVLSPSELCTSVVPLSTANRIKHDVRKWCRKRYRTKCTESSECSSTQSKDDNSPTRLSSLSSSKRITTKANGVLPVQNEGQYTPNGAGISSNIYQNAVLSSNTTVLSSKDAKVSIRSEVSKARSKPGVVMNTVRASASRKTVVANSGIVLKNTAEDILPISEKKNTANSSTVCGSDVLPAASPYRKRKSTLCSEDRKISEGKIKSTETKKRGTSVTYKNVIPVNTLSDQVAVLPSGVVKVPVDRNLCENFMLSETSLYASGQHAFSSGHKTSLSRPMPSPKKNLNKDIIPAPADSDMKRQSELSSKHFVLSPSELCASVVPRVIPSESGRTPYKKAPPPPSSRVEPDINKLLHYMAVLFSDPESKENEPCHQLSDKGQGIGFTSTNTRTLVQNKKVLSETGHDQSASTSVSCKESTSTTCKQIAPVLPLYSNIGSKDTATGTSPEVRGRKKSDYAARNHSVSNLLDQKVPLSLSGNLVPCVGNTATTQKHNSASLCSTSEKQCTEPAVNIRNLEMTQHQSCITSSISIACKDSMSIEREHMTCGEPLCPGVENKDKEICLSPEIKRKKISDCTLRNSTESVMHNFEVPGSSSGSSVACVGRTGNIYQPSSTITCNTAGEGFVEPTVTFCESDIAQSQSQNLKLSREISEHPCKFSLIKSNSFEILMAGHKTPKKKSPSKKLSKSSPINYVRKNHSPCKQMNGCTSAKRVLGFGSFGTKKKLGSFAQPENESIVPDLFYQGKCVSYFDFIIVEVLKDKAMLSLLSEEEVNVVISFWKLEHQVKKLYIRMLSRKYTWHHVSDIKYDDIDVPAAFTELEISGLITSDYSSEELEILLNLLKLADLRVLCQTFRIPLSAQSKPKLIQALMHYGQSQQTISGSQRGDSRAMIRSRLMEALGHCVKLCDEGREGFRRIVRLFSLHHHDYDDDRETSKQLILLHFVKTGKVKFPTYAILKTRPIFSSRDDLMRFEEASEILTHLVNALSMKRWDEAQIYGQHARERFRALVNNSVVNDQVKSLPLFMRRCTAGSLYAYAMTKAVEAFKKHKDQLLECVIILKELLCQDVYLPQFRGKWYEELALILQVRLKNLDQAAAIVIEALKDNCLNEIYQQMISARGFLLLRKKGIIKNLKKELREIVMVPLKKPPSVTIKTKSVQINAPGRKQVYVLENTCRQEITYSSVEECAISHYKSEGYIEGVHDEGGTIESLFGLIFWDIIYEHPVPDVFRSSYQHLPLDLRSGEFYKNRKERIDKRLETLCKWDMKYVQDYVEKIFKENEGKVSVVNWQRFRNLQQIVGLIKCIGVQVLSKILERLVKNYRAVCSGFPDLLVWNPDSSKCKFVEVKGPGDRLSVAQNMWLNYLTECNANAEVCHVETTGAKKQKLNMSTVPDGEDVCLIKWAAVQEDNGVWSLYFCQK